jgi:hypothetical protein
MNFSIICTAIPSLGRLIVELQPEVNAFAITERHGSRSHDQFAFSSFGHRFQREYVVNNRLGVRTSVRGNPDSDSFQGLTDDGMGQNSDALNIKHTVGFQVKYMAKGVV